MEFCYNNLLRLRLYLLLLSLYCSLTLQAAPPCEPKCSGTDTSPCEMTCSDQLEKYGRFTCKDSKCSFCSKRLNPCKFNGTGGAGFDGPNARETACCDKGDMRNVACFQAKKNYKYKYLCLPECDTKRNLQTCTDQVTKRNFTAIYTSCTGASGKKNTFTECIDTGSLKPRECGATGVACKRDYSNGKVGSYDNCCVNFFCDDTGKCKPECPAGGDCDNFKYNKFKQPCAYADSVKTIPCMDKNKRVFMDRYLKCTTPTMWFECPHNQDLPPRNCGATDAACEYFAKEHTCCNEFKCSLKNKCVPQCPPNSATTCTPTLAKYNCKTTYKKCMDPMTMKVLSAMYLECTGKNGNKNKFIECLEPTKAPRECGNSGTACDADKNPCCQNFKCGMDSKCALA